MVLAAVLVAGVAITLVLAIGDSDDDPAPVARTTVTTSPPTTGLSPVAPVTPSTDVVTTAPPGAPRDAVLGTWDGVYVCAQGDTRLRLTFRRGPGPADLRAVFVFGPTEDNPTVPRGSYRMEGTLFEGLLRLRATTWIDKPAGYVTVDLEAPVVGDRPPHILGDVVDVAECSTFAVTRQDG